MLNHNKTIVLDVLNISIRQLKLKDHSLNKILTTFFLLLSVSIGLAQDENEVIEDEIYFDHIKSVKFHHSSLPTSYPIIDLNSSGLLKLSFDDMEGANKDYIYSIFHCDKDWKRSQIDEMEYLDGFNDEEITNTTFSSQTIHDYTHYELLIPNEETNWTLSGNYILQIMDEDEDNMVILTKRFLVTESLVKMSSETLPPFAADKYNTHQRLDFSIDLNKFYISDPMNELSVHIIQNNRWDNAILNLKPQTAIGDQINFNKFNTSTFPGGKEFRYFDTRDIQINSDRTESIAINTYSIDLRLKKERKREFKNYIFWRDGNGTFIPNSASSVRNGKATSEYINTTFTLDSDNPIYGHELYVVGEFSSWKLYPENQLTYYESEQIYTADILLKQGYYNYYYAAIDDKNEVSFVETEGNWFETENDYTILVYYRQLGARYDRLIGVSTVNSLKDQ